VAHPEAKEPSRAPRRRPTATSNFGAGRRESHDATAFYERFEAPTLSGDDAVEAPAEVAEPFVHGDARHMDTITDGSVALVVTSPPYFAGKQYEEELERDGIPSSYVEYLQLLTDVFAECARKLEPGGRIAVNVANLGRKPYRSLAADVVHILQDQLQLLLRGEVVWRKGEGAAGSCAWGSFRSAANPVLRDTTERVVIASKGRFDRALSRADRERRGLPSVNTIDADEFMAATLDVWDIEPESARRVSHPAPFPVGLPGRLIDLYTYENDLVLDPFMGSGSTLVAAARRGRRYVGYDLDPTYVDIARLRVRDEGIVAAPEPVAERPTSETVDEADNFQARATKEGKAAQALAEELLVNTGFKIVAKNKRLPGTGVTINFIATDADEVEWYFDVSGAFTSTRGGLLRTDTVWKTLGRAHVLRGEQLQGPLVFLTSHLPRKGSEGFVALKNVAEQGGFFDAIEMRSADGYERLRKYAEGGHSEVPLSGFLA
jgi:DNA modification methylase